MRDLGQYSSVLIDHEFFLHSGKWDVKHIPVSLLPSGISAARENSGLACHLPQLECVLHGTQKCA